ncbi:MAG: cytochrome c [Alphaproteobacteria bacterium]|nr:cytochrome c [Alphaproteobacteria bacterium]
MRRILFATTLGVALAAGSAYAADTPENLVKYRKAVMKSLGGHFGAISAVVKGEVSYGAHVANHARALRDVAPLIGAVFPPNSTYDQFKDTNALPEVWSKPAEFKQAVEAFEKAAADFVPVAEAGDAQAITASFGAMARTCGGCHKTFRYDPKKK